MQFTQEQVRSLAHVSVGDMRQWRRSIPYLAEKTGKAARFTFNDVVALALVAELTDTCGLQVRAFSSGIDSLFRRLTELHPTSLQELFVVINRDETKFLKFDQTRESDFHISCCIVRLDPILDRIERQMLPLRTASTQVTLPFPPQILKTGQ
jgi:hypothetical protein